jgi:hypothetical protein
VTILGGPPGAWQGAPINVYDAPAEAREQARQMCGTPSSPCHSVIVGGPGSVGSWQGQPVIILDSQRIVPRGRTP